MNNLVSDLPKSAIVPFINALPNFEPADIELDGGFKLGDNRPETPLAVLTEGSDSQELDADFDRVRTNLANLSDKSAEVVEDLLTLARETESPRAYEVLTTAIKTLLDANKDLLEVHAKKADIKGKLAIKGQPQNQTNVQNNTLFVGSSEELLELLSKNKKGFGQ